jgi:putative oxidoreductase
MSIVALLQRAKQAALPVADLPLRLVLGIVFIAHGLDKVAGTFGGGGFQATAVAFGEMGLQPGWFHAALGGGGELIGGILVLLGLFTRFGAFLLAATMVVAVLLVHLPNGLFAKDGGFEYPLTLLGAALTILLSGAGPISLDRLLFKGKF